jgi:hypothetical protein
MSNAGHSHRLRIRSDQEHRASGTHSIFPAQSRALAKNREQCLCRIGAKRLRPLAQIFINSQVTCRSGRTPAFSHQLDCVKLELSTEASSRHDLLPAYEAPKPGVHRATRSSQHQPFCRLFLVWSGSDGFRRRAPRPPPFSSMNSMPACSRAPRTSSSVRK